MWSDPRALPRQSYGLSIHRQLVQTGSGQAGRRVLRRTLGSPGLRPRPQWIKVSKPFVA